MSQRGGAVTNPQRSGFHVFSAQSPYVVFEQRSWQPFLNVCETDDAIVVIIELAGVDPSMIDVHVEANLLRIHGMRQMALPKGMRRIDRMEITSGPFQIELPFNRPVDPAHTESRYYQGLLEIVLPLAQWPAQRIVVNVTDGDD